MTPNKTKTTNELTNSSTCFSHCGQTKLHFLPITQDIQPSLTPQSNPPRLWFWPWTFFQVPATHLLVCLIYVPTCAIESRLLKIRLLSADWNMRHCRQQNICSNMIKKKKRLRYDKSLSGISGLPLNHLGSVPSHSKSLKNTPEKKNSYEHFRQDHSSWSLQKETRE